MILQKELLRLFNYVMSWAWYIAFGIASMASGLFVFAPLEVVLIELPFLAFLIVSGSYNRYRKARDEHHKLVKKVNLARAAGVEISSKDAEAVLHEPLAIRVLLRYTAITNIAMAPVIALISTIVFSVFQAIFVFASIPTDHKTIRALLIQIAVYGVGFGWLLCVVLAWLLISRAVEGEQEPQQANNGISTAKTNPMVGEIGLWGCLMFVIAPVIPLVVAGMIIGIGGYLLLISPLTEDIKNFAFMTLTVSVFVGIPVVLMSRNRHNWEKQLKQSGDRKSHEGAQ